MTKVDKAIEKIYKTIRNNSRMILYSDPIGRPGEDGKREQVTRDDLWAISTDELEKICELFDQEKQALIKEILSNFKKEMLLFTAEHDQPMRDEAILTLEATIKRIGKS